MRLVEKELPMFAGLYYAHDYMDRVMLLKEKMPHYNYIIGTGTSMEGHLVQGFEAVSMIAMNICPDLVKDVYDRLREFKLREAMMSRDKMVKRIFDMMRLDTDVDLVETMKKEMNKTLNMGPMRKPRTTTYRYWMLDWFYNCYFYNTSNILFLYERILIIPINVNWATKKMFY